MKPKRPPSKFKRFLIEHIEKVALGIGVVLALLIILAGFRSRQGIEPSKTPPSLEQEVQQTTGYIDSFDWDRDFRAERAVDTDLLKRAGETLRPVEVKEYALNQYIKPPYHAPRKMRTEPSFYGATDLEVRSGWGILARRNRSGRPGGSFGPGRSPEEEKGRPMGQGGGFREGSSGAIENAEGTHFVVVTGLVPYRKQVKDYYDRFRNADGYLPERDFPMYLDWNLERAEVHPGAEPKWQKVADLRKMANANRRGDRNQMRENDGIDPRCELRSLTSSMPPISGSNLTEIARHSKIPTFEDAMRREWADRWGGANGPGRQGFDGMGGEQRGGPPSFGGDGDVGGERRVEMPIRDGAMGEIGPSSPDRMNGFGGPQGPGGDIRGSSGRGGSMGFAEQFNPEHYAENVMFRYFDFDVEVGKTYQYRLQLTIEDPNTPQNESYEPEPSSLSEDVLVRKAESEKRDYRHETPFSDPSPSVTVSPGQRMLVGTVTPAREITVADSKVFYTRAATPPKAKVIVAEFDEDRAAELPLEIDVIPGSTGYAKGRVEPVYQWKLWLGEPEDNKLVRVNAVVIDTHGGEQITPRNKGDLSSPGSLLVWDASKRQLTVLKELRDAKELGTLIVPAESALDRGGFGDRGQEGRGSDRQRNRRGEGGMEGGTGDAGRGSGDFRGGPPSPRRRPG